MKLFLIAAFMICTSLNASKYEVDYTKSYIQFSAEHVGQPFTGKFQKWNADITFDPTDLKNSSVIVDIYPGSAETLNTFYNTSLKGEEWFDTKTFEKANFTSRSFKKLNDGTFLVQGILKIKDQQHNIDFSFKLTEDTTSPSAQVVATAVFNIDRLQYNLGKKSDPDAEWISKVIKINLYVNAVKK